MEKREKEREIMKTLRVCRNVLLIINQQACTVKGNNIKH